MSLAQQGSSAAVAETLYERPSLGRVELLYLLPAIGILLLVGSLIGIVAFEVAPPLNSYLFSSAFVLYFALSLVGVYPRS